MISASKTTFSHNNLKISRPKVTKNLTNLPKKFCKFRPGTFSWLNINIGVSISATYISMHGFLNLSPLQPCNKIWYYLSYMYINEVKRHLFGSQITEIHFCACLCVPHFQNIKKLLVCVISQVIIWSTQVQFYKIKDLTIFLMLKCANSLRKGT